MAVAFDAAAKTLLAGLEASDFAEMTRNDAFAELSKMMDAKWECKVRKDDSSGEAKLTILEANTIDIVQGDK
jgi:hypothetical protein